MERIENAVILTAQEYEELKKAAERKPRKTTSVVLVILAVFLLAFIITMIVTYWMRGGVPDTLIQMTMGAGGVEALLLAGIKISKIIKGEKTESEE